MAALTRSRADELRAAGIDPIIGDISEPARLGSMLRADTVLYAVGWDRTSGRTFQETYIDGLRNVLEALPAPNRFIYISSTSVYGQDDGNWVNEQSPTTPTEANGKIVLEAEQLLRSKLPDAIVLRFAGIYGPGRILRQKAIEKGEPLLGNADKWLNLIHVDDGAQAVLAAEGALSKARPTWCPMATRFVVANSIHSWRSSFTRRPPASNHCPPERRSRRMRPAIGGLTAPKWLGNWGLHCDSLTIARDWRMRSRDRAPPSVAANRFP